MLDIGLGEVLVIAVIALLIFGPDRLPKVAADAARTLRQIRTMAAAARRDLSDAAGLSDDADLSSTLRDLRDLDPRRALRGLVTDPPAAPVRGTDAAPGPSSPVTPEPGVWVDPGRARRTTPPAAAGPGGSGSSAAGSSAAGSSAAGSAARSPAAPVVAAAPPVVAPADADPDWT